MEYKELIESILLENTLEMIHQLDEFGNILWVNKAWRNSLEIGNDDVKGLPLVSFLTDETMIEFGEVFPKLQNGESVENLNCTFKTKNGNIIHLLGRTIPLFEDEKVTGSQAFLQDVTELMRVQNDLRDFHNLQSILMRISTRFININFEELDQAIDTSLKEIALYSNADRAYVYRYNLNLAICENTHEWCADGIQTQIESLQKIQISDMPFWFSQHSKGNFVEVEDVSLVEEPKLREMLENEQIKSFVTIPLMNEEQVIGFIGFDNLHEKRNFRAEEKEILILFSQMLVNVFNRMKNIEELKSSKDEIEKINATLEQKVFANTKKNLDLTKSIIEQEKLATIGEISAGIAHDLNTPLGTIKVGSDNIRFILDDVFRNKISKFSSEQLNFAMDRIQNSPVEIYVGGLQLRKEKTELLAFLKERFVQLLPDELDKIAELFVKCRVSQSDEGFIREILNKSDAISFLELLYQVQVACNQLETIKISSDKAVKVVQEVRAFIKGDANVEKKSVNLRQNIATVLNVFNYDLQKNVDLKFNVDDSFSFQGYDIKLFQLWSNLVKNAIEAMENQEYRYLGIFAEKKNGKLAVTFENNGPKISDEVMNNMFKKFYTTKSKKSGSGLGLSIVKNILRDHKAHINVESSDEITKFIITFEA